MAGDIICTVHQEAANTSTGNQTFTNNDFGGGTPKAAIFIVTKGVTAGTAIDDIQFSYGVADADAQWVVSCQSEHGQADSDADNQSATDECIMLLAADGTIDGEANWVSFGADAVTVNWANAPAAAVLVTVILLGGADLSVDVGTISLTTENGTTNATPGFVADLVLTAYSIDDFDDAVNVHARLSFGAATAGITQRALSWGSRDAQASAAAILLLSTDRCAEELRFVGSTVQSSAEITSLTAGAGANEIVFTTRDGDGTGDGVGYLALELDGQSAWVGSVASPADGADWDSENVAFTPQIVGLGLSMLTSEDAISTSGAAGSVGMAVATKATADFSAVVSEDDGPPTTNNQSLTDTRFINLPNDAGAQRFDIANPVMDSTGWTVTDANIADAQTGHKWFGWAVEVAAAGGFVLYPNPRYSMTGGMQPMNGGV